MGQSPIPDHVLDRWSKPEDSRPLQAVLLFCGNPQQEAAIDFFRDICSIPSGEAPAKGMFHLATRRFVFLPGGDFVH
jgi:hypothetical protein